MGHYALLILFMLITFSANSEPDECQDFKTDVFICMNEGAESVYARYGREYKGKLPRTDMFTMCRLKKSEWFIDEKGKKDMSYKCTYEHPQNLPDIIMTTGPRYQCPRNIQCKIK
tara:strand:+ start:264 stop:608 length:345 start_codon:yes stop_codon:yes gene_type:complete